ncbi:XRE family transcriptional regulator [Actinokineospora soli]|uniref:XRE family transcriptional regulator n=1 Tax=Actinokineospora soli TaxID=1048753 RepID=A0ABW2TMY3_9PSEU
MTNGDPAFPAALRAAIERRGISLDRLRERLRVMGTPVSTATLSYWQSGRTQPERSVSLAALGNIEHIVGVPPGALATLLDPPKPRGRARTRQTVLGTEFFPDVAPLERLLAGFDLSQDAHLTRLSGHDRIRVDAGRGVDRRISRQVLRAEADDIDRLVVIDQMDLPCSRPRLRAVRNCALGRVEVDLAAGLVAAELLFSRPLARNETILIEHSLEFPSPRRRRTTSAAAAPRPRVPGRGAVRPAPPARARRALLGAGRRREDQARAAGRGRHRARRGAGLRAGPQRAPLVLARRVSRATALSPARPRVRRAPAARRRSW